MNVGRGCGRGRPYLVGNYNQLREIWRSEFRVENRVPPFKAAAHIAVIIRENAEILHGRRREEEERERQGDRELHPFIRVRFL